MYIYFASSIDSATKKTIRAQLHTLLLNVWVKGTFFWTK